MWLPRPSVSACTWSTEAKGHSTLFSRSSRISENSQTIHVSHLQPARPDKGPGIFYMSNFLLGSTLLSTHAVVRGALGVWAKRVPKNEAFSSLRLRANHTRSTHNLTQS